MKKGGHFPVPRRPRAGQNIAQYIEKEIIPAILRRTPQDGRDWMVSKAGPRGWSGQAAGRGPRFRAPYMGFELVPGNRLGLTAEADEFVVLPSIIDAAFHEEGAELTPVVGEVSLEDYPLLTAESTRKGVYAKVELTYHETTFAPLIEGDWEIELHAAKPAETTLSRDSGGEITNGIYYKRIGTAQYTDEAGLVLVQDRLGPWEAEWCPITGTLKVTALGWALTSIEAQEEEP